MKPLSKGLFYSQPALGIGQLTRSLNICKCLLTFSEIDFVLGSPLFGEKISDPQFHLYELPPLWIQEWKNPPELIDPYSKKNSAEIFKEREQYLKRFEGKHYDYFFIELFPFSKQRFSEEIHTLIAQVKKVNPQCPIICSCRDIVGRKNTAEQKLIVEEIQRSFSHIFVHADPSIIRLDETFDLASQFADKIVYTGYVSNPDFSFLLQERKKQIVISLGSGAYGWELPKAVIVTALFLKDYSFLFFLGPKSPESLKRELAQMKQTFGLQHVELAEFSPNFYQILAESSLSISLGGSTLVDIVKTRTPALAYTQAHVEHQLRVEKFASLGLVKPLSMEDLLPEKLFKIIYNQANAPFPDSAVNLSGAENTTLEVQRMVSLSSQSF